MGGVSVLLMIAAMGITYGWQPDDHGGVEYIIQIPPDQLHEIERVGEITSLIDPAVRGHVSRVIIKVGKGPLPRTSAIFARRQDAQPDRNVIVASDQTPVPIPEMGAPPRATPIPSLDPAVLTDDDTPAAVMKPDANQSSGPGFSFPALPSTLRDTGSNAASLSRGQMPETASVGPQNNRTQPQPPSFTGSDPTGALARTRQGGPTTDPAGNRDNTWRGFATNPAGGPSTDPIAPANNRFGAPAANLQNRATTDTTASRQAATGISPSDTFGKLPGGLSLPATANQPSTAFGGAATYPANASRNANNQMTNMSTTNSQAANLQVPNSQTRVYSQYEQTQIDLQRSNAARGAAQYDPTRGNSMPTGNYSQATSNGQGVNYSRTANDGFNNQTTASVARDGQVPQTRMGPDARLTQPQIEAGAWSVDIYNRPIDRDGKLIQTTDHVAGVFASDIGRPIDRYTDRTYSPLGRPAVNQPLSTATTTTTNQQVQPGAGPYPYNAPVPADTRFVNDSSQPARSDLIRPARPANGAQLDPPSLSNRSAATVSAGEVANVRSTNQKHVAAQPLFNGMLLISFVANIYLIFWLKNLRLQFRDLVAAKRISNSSGQTV